MSRPAAGLPASLPLPEGLVDGIERRELSRLLGWPRERPLSEEVERGVEAARAWYRRRGRPVALLRRVAVRGIDGDSVHLESGHELASAELARRLGGVGAESVVVVALSAGREIDAEIDVLWGAGRVDEGYFLDRLGAAVAELLVGHVRTRLCAVLEPEGLSVLPHLSPGCGGWDLADQHVLAELVLNRLLPEDGASPIEVLESGALHPRASLLAAFGIAPAERITHEPELVACRSCDLEPCTFRRAPYRLPAAEALPRSQT